MSIKFTKSDVRVERAEVAGCGECTDGDFTSEPKGTHWILVDFRSAGESVQMGPFLYCEKCAHEIVERIRESLPEDEAEEADWQPIETAPKDDGPSFLVWCPLQKSGNVYHVFRYADDDRFRVYASGGRLLYEIPTLWRPLPASPTGDVS